MVRTPHVDPTRTTAMLLVGDLVCIGLFSVLGVLQHESGPLLIRALEVAAPFVVGWLLVGTAAGVFGERALASPRRAGTRAAVAWLGADIVGQGLRATSILRGGFDPAFFLVSLAFTGALLVGWRALAARLLG